MNVHIDPADSRRPLPLKEELDLDQLVEPLRQILRPERGTIAVGHGHFGITLFSDSPHLQEFFIGNWGNPTPEGPTVCEATIVAMRGESVPGAPQLRAGVRFVNPGRSLIVSAGNEYYGNIKISVRGLCSAAVHRIGGGFLHGASLSVGETGIVIGGASGAGKTTTTRALFDLYPGDVRMINDDWGWADSDRRMLRYTGEPNLHMKYRSVRTIAPTLAISPDLHLSENYEGDADNPHARLLIPRDLVFNGVVAESARFGAYVVVVRDKGKPFFCRQLDPDDVSILEAAEYSAFYQRHERFLDGSLLLLSDADLDAERRRFRRLLSQVPSLLVNNVSTPTELANAVWGQIHRIAK